MREPLQHFVIFGLDMYLQSLYRCFISGIYAFPYFSIFLKIKITENSVISFSIFSTEKISYTCCAIHDLFGYWKVYLISLLMQFKSTLPVTLSNIEGSLGIVTPVFFTLTKNPCNSLSHTQYSLDPRNFI